VHNKWGFVCVSGMFAILFCGMPVTESKSHPLSAWLRRFGEQQQQEQQHVGLYVGVILRGNKGC
jgi:hypothetical protein